jgi:hypothetical protein
MIEARSNALPARNALVRCESQIPLIWTRDAVLCLFVSLERSWDVTKNWDRT